MSNFKELFKLSTTECIQKSLSAVEEGVHKGDGAQIYDAMADYTTLMVAGGEFKRDPKEEQRNVKIFAADIEHNISKLQLD